jgi:hypothetical protein
MRVLATAVMGSDNAVFIGTDGLAAGTEGKVTSGLPESSSTAKVLVGRVLIRPAYGNVPRAAIGR